MEQTTRSVLLTYPLTFTILSDRSHVLGTYRFRKTLESALTIQTQIHALVAKGQTILAEHQQPGKRDFSQGRIPRTSEHGTPFNHSS